LIGSGKTTAKPRSGWLTHLTQRVHRYVGIDGGAGAHLLTDLAGRDPYLQQGPSPRQADLLILVEPISRKLLPAVVTEAKALAHPAHVLIVGEPEAGLATFPGTDLPRLDDLFPGAHRVASASVEQVLDAALHAERWSEINTTNIPAEEETTIQLPSKQDQEMATELAVLSLGPIQPFTNGPLRLFLMCDGEQVFSVQMETEYAYRGIDAAMTRVDWQQGLILTRHFDPLAPIAGQLAYVRAIEQLQGWQAPAPVERYREVALALERAQNVLWWLVRFASILDDASLLQRSYQLTRNLTEVRSWLWQKSPEEWIVPQHVATGMIGRNNVSVELGQVSDGADALRQYAERNRGLALRTRGIGILAVEQLKKSDVKSGPVLSASEHGSGDVQSRLVTRLQAAVSDLRLAAEMVVSQTAEGSAHSAAWDVPVGEARTAVTGPRGTIGLHLVHQDAKEHDGPTQVEWQRPSAPLVALLPELLVGQKLADAEVILASLDLAMAEVDG